MPGLEELKFPPDAASTGSVGGSPRTRPREVTSPMPLGKARDLMQSLMARGCSYAFALSCAQNEAKEEARGG
ncbi:hypothetical protein [uncultured Maritimibacter sp.]|uniref:hypothetical protein n=1 Tax=uncultured Maritimibacter sp. TaxID=991866 RepID=UPI0025950254|nr:hypothetical protein [uncultured Maritimibacter sp.]